MKRSWKLALASAGVAATMAAGVITPVEAQVPFWANTTVQVGGIVGSGSDTTYFLMNSLSAAYNESDGCALTSVTFPPTGTQNRCRPEVEQAAAVVRTENYDHDIAFSYYPQGSSAGRRQLCSQTAPRPAGVPFVTYARSSAAPGDGFSQCTDGTTLRYVAFAKDALTWVKWTGNPVANLTQGQLNDIYVDCTITNWNQVGGNNAPIGIWTAIAASGSRATWDSFIGGSSDSCIPAAYKDGDPNTPASPSCPGERVIREHQAAIPQNDPCLTNEADSIFFASVGVHNAQPGAKAASIFGNIDGFAPTEGNIQSGDFPFSRFVYNVYRQSGPAPTVTPQTAGFVGTNGWICKPAAQHTKPTGDPDPGAMCS